MIRWLVAAALVAGTFGVVWTAPWKDDTEYLTAEATHRLGTTFSTIGLRADRNACDAVARPPKPDEIAAVAIVLAELRVHPAARMAPLDGDARAATVREVAATRSRDIAGCLSKATVQGTWWADLQRRWTRDSRRRRRGSRPSRPRRCYEASIDAETGVPALIVW